MTPAAGPPFEVVTTAELDRALRALKRRDPAKFKKVAKVRRHLADPGPAHPGLKTHQWEGVRAGVDDRQIWYSYVENHTPSAWRAWWVYGPARGQITMLDVGPHPRD